MTLEGHRREILVLARTGYVVLRIEPAPLACLAPLRVATGLPAPFRRSPGWLPSPRRYGASSAFPTLTGLVALAAGLAAVYGPANAPETPSKPCARHRGRRRCGYLAENLALTDR
ncbi:hypothetical protein GCI44_18815 [Salmonella enterica]|nr:hypothetical protein [Salmonella enterica]EAT9889211.1 hypothetical protein [Salmonella enterica subsp. enterica serovar Kentucky]EDL5350426.1 hypothetical protein [Salmonella enterica subsp. enterica serovar Heidelberg]EFI4382091.1 hypothetical protein [Escherichia coli]EBD3966153.1 hypothetical protein [Salmonella enterica]